MGTSIKLIAIIVILAMFGGAFWYISGLRASLATSEQNTKLLSDAVQQQQAVLEQVQEEQAAIQKANQELSTLVQTQMKDVNALRDKFSTSADGSSRDFGKLAIAKPSAIERAINKGSLNAMRCMEIASGSPVLKDETNAECPSLVTTVK